MECPRVLKEDIDFFKFSIPLWYVFATVLSVDFAISSPKCVKESTTRPNFANLSFSIKDLELKDSILVLAGWILRPVRLARKKKSCWSLDT